MSYTKLKSLLGITALLRPLMIGSFKQEPPRPKKMRVPGVYVPARPRSGPQEVINRMTNWQRHQWWKAGCPGIRGRNDGDFAALEYYAGLQRPNRKAGGKNG